VALLAAPTLPAVLASLGGAKVAVGVLAVALLWRGARLAAPDFGACAPSCPSSPPSVLTNLVGLLNYRVGLFVIERLLGLSRPASIRSPSWWPNCCGSCPAR
jgi:hypothetical protein